MSKVYKVVMLIALLLPQVHYLPQLVGNQETNVLMLIFWVVVLTISYVASGILLTSLVGRWKIYYKPSTIISVRLFLAFFGIILLSLFFSVIFEEVLYFIGYFIPYLGGLLLMGYVFIYYSVVLLILRDINNMIAGRKFSRFEKFGLLIPFIAFGFSLFSGYFISSLFGSPISFNQQESTNSLVDFISLFLMIASLANTLTIMKIGKDWIVYSEVR